MKPHRALSPVVGKSEISMPKKEKVAKTTADLIKFLRSKKFRRIRGVSYILLSLFLTLALLSFVLRAGDERNVMGALGWLAAKLLADRLFGVASLGLTALLFLYGVHLLRKLKIRWWHVLGVVFFWMIWLSTSIGYVCQLLPGNAYIEHFAGIGATLADLLHHLLNWGTIVFLVFVAVLFLVLVHHVNVKMPNIALPSGRDKEQEDGEEPVGLMERIRSLLRFRSKDDEEEEENDEVDDDANEEEQPVGDEGHQEQEDEGDDEGDEHVTFNIDDEFERVNNNLHKDEDTGGNEPGFTINEPEDDNTGSNAGGGEDEGDNAEIQDDDDYARHFDPTDLYDPQLELKLYDRPPTSLLYNWEEKNERISREELVANKDRIVKTLRDFNIEIVEISASPGPTVTLYEIKPSAGTRISRIKGLEDDIALSLSAIGIRIIAPIPGRGTIGIEVPNAKPQIVSMRTMLESPAFRENTKMELPVAIGKTISNEVFVTDLAKMPHLLMAGATGTGKSVGLNAVITSLLYKKHPAELKFVMVDPKKVELSLYSKIERHYLAKLPDSEEAIITDVKKVVRTLNSLCIEMDQRYDLLKMAQVRKITEYNDKFIHRHLNPTNGHRYLPYIVLVIDEFADLIMTAGKEVEQPICRLAQLARAVGIHLIIATQRPTTNIITGTIKANFPARIAFKVTSAIDSRTILDMGGAQNLIGRGDMLISLSGSDLVRLQCALVETKEIDAVVAHIANQRGYPEAFLLPEYLDENDEISKDVDLKQRDELFEDAARLVFSCGLASTSLLQRKMTIGFARAGRIIDQLEAAGIIGPANGSKPRDLMVRDEQSLNEILSNL